MDHGQPQRPGGPQAAAGVPAGAQAAEGVPAGPQNRGPVADRGSPAPAAMAAGTAPGQAEPAPVGAEPEPLIFSYSRPGRGGMVWPEPDVPVRPVEERVPADCCARKPPPCRRWPRSTWSGTIPA